MQQSNSNITLQGVAIFQLLSPEEKQQLQAEMQACIDRWYRLKFSLTAMSMLNGNIPQQETAQETTG